MIFFETPLKGAFLLEVEKREDDRGYFARTFCQREFEAHGLNPRVVQCSVSFNRRKGTLRGMHWQASPYEEAKLVSCLRGGIYDVIVDLRAGSSTHTRHFATELSAVNRRMLYVPEGFAHGFQTLAPGTAVTYRTTAEYSPPHERGIRWDDRMLSIPWPIREPHLSARDRQWPTMTDR